MKITSSGNNKVKYYRKLMKNKKFRDQEQVFIVEGNHLVKEAINENVVKELVISNEEYDQYQDVDKVYVTDEIMNRICDTITPQGIIALCKQKEDNDLPNYKRILLLDNIQDPGNLGTIIRSADAFNFDGIVLNTLSVDIYNPKVVRSTQGAIFRMPIIKRDLASYILFLIEKGINVYGTSLDGEDLSLTNSEKQMAFIMGNEGNGVAPEILDLTTKNLFIEMNGNSESLNVAIAASIIMYIFRK